MSENIRGICKVGPKKRDCCGSERVIVFPNAARDCDVATTLAHYLLLQNEGRIQEKEPISRF